MTALEISSEEKLSFILTAKFTVWVWKKEKKKHLKKPDAFQKQVLWTDEVKMELSGCSEINFVCNCV